VSKLYLLKLWPNMPKRKNSILLLMVLSCYVWIVPGYADNQVRRPSCKPTDICYNKKGSSLLNGEYAEYSVRCSDGSKHKLVYWQNTKKWCIGTIRSTECTKRGQMYAAKLACSK